MQRVPYCDWALWQAGPPIYQCRVCRSAVQFPAGQGPDDYSDKLPPCSGHLPTEEEATAMMPNVGAWQSLLIAEVDRLLELPGVTADDSASEENATIDRLTAALTANAFLKPPKPCMKNSRR